MLEMIVCFKWMHRTAKICTKGTSWLPFAPTSSNIMVYAMNLATTSELETFARLMVPFPPTTGQIVRSFD